MDAPGPDPRLVPTLGALIRCQFQARGFSFLHRQPVTSLLAGRRASRIRGRGLAFEELRAYRPGDDVRQIDWRASARTGRTQTRVFTEERDRPTLLLADLTAATFFGSVHATKAAVIAEATALAAWLSLRFGDRVGAIVFGDDGLEEHHPQRSRAAVMRVLGALAARAAALPAAPPRPVGAGPLNAALARAEAIAGHDWLVLVAADLQAFDLAADQAIGRIARHNDVIAVTVSDPLERALPAPPWQGRATADGARVVVLDPGRGGLGAKVRAAHERRLEAVRRGGIRLETPVLPIGTEEDAAPQLRRLLGGAAAPKRRRST
ncbi:DUF58 domain-containing protein [Roseomonas sp. M0104]|uniref:DUF58 domain-containing protein n=1 Tax=Teichococcus coralli TaxID=2545983 RepID=A0A845BAD2_9PROT|nr:DUF58 domain-containing protein [Pseudoroseomonas coralli]MXP63568.1 DUF58 domain-containing protein [Pseudoroseomonas coralli]